MGTNVSISKKCQKHVSTLEGDTATKKQKTFIAATQTDEDGYFWIEYAKLWTDENMNFFRCEVVRFVNTKYRARYKYVE